jgi:murein tripeptide amidase MpaA
MTKSLLPVLVFLCVLRLEAPPFAGPEQTVEIVSVAATEGNMRALAGIRADVLKAGSGRVHIVATIADLGQLSALGVPFAVETALFAPARPFATSAAGGLNGDFHSYRELESDLEALEDAYPGTVKLAVIGTSLEGRNIYAVKLSDDPERNDGEPGVLILGCHHAREWISVDVPLLLARYLAESAASDPAVRSLLARGEIWIVPLVNPDGLEIHRRLPVLEEEPLANRQELRGGPQPELWIRGAGRRRSSPSPLLRSANRPFPGERAVGPVLSRVRAVVSSTASGHPYPWGYADIRAGRDEALREIRLAGLSRP